MTHKFKYTITQKLIVFISLILLSISVFLDTREVFEEKTEYKINYEYVNIKDMAKAKVASKTDNSNIIDNIFNGQIIETSLNGEEDNTAKEVQTPVAENSEAAQTEPKRIWYMPTDMGYITQNPSYWHVAHDLSSPRGVYEVIHPIANGKVSGIYRDSAGALVVTVLHNVGGKYYTSQYVHLSSYAPGLHVGQDVTINDSLGQMGSSGNSTGVHLHIAVLDCALFSNSDPNCKDLNGWYRYDKIRYQQGFYGLWSLLDVPAVWYSR